MKKTLSLIILSHVSCFISHFSFAQQNITEDCNKAVNLKVNSHHEIIPEQEGQILQYDSLGNYVFFNQGSNNISSWYKILVQSDCELTFNISQGNTDDVYNFFMYKQPSKTNFCEDVVNKKIIPVRANLYKNKEEKNKKDDLYQSAQHRPLNAKSGDVYYINVYHISGNSCGHFLKLSAGKAVSGFRTVYKDCFTEQLQRKEVTMLPEEKKTAGTSEISVSTSENSSEVPVTWSRQVKISGVVLDSASKKPLQAEIKWADEFTGKEIVCHTNPNGEYLIPLDEKIIYKLTCTVIGYREKTTKLIRQNLRSSHMNSDFIMTPLKAGETFVLKHLYFYAGTYAMRPESKPELEKLVSFMKTNEKVKIEIQGHTNGEGKIKLKKTDKELGKGWDFTGNEKKLSRLRADEVKKFLVDAGVGETRIVTEGMGATKMIYPEPKNQKEKDANKRVEIYILSTTADLTSVLNAISE